MVVTHFTTELLVVFAYMFLHCFRILGSKIANMTHIFAWTAVLVIPNCLVISKYFVTMWALKWPIPITNLSVTHKVSIKRESRSTNGALWALLLIFAPDLMLCYLLPCIELFTAQVTSLLVLCIAIISRIIIFINMFRILCLLTNIEHVDLKWWCFT